MPWLVYRISACSVMCGKQKNGVIPIHKDLPDSLVASYRRCARPGMGSSLGGELRKRRSLTVRFSNESGIKTVDPLR